jgi:hypothetical protein
MFLQLLQHRAQDPHLVLLVLVTILTPSRHAWGIKANQEQAVHYLSLAASNSAEVEKLALESGVKKGGAAKGELVLAMYELANCFRNGWGIKKDPAAAKQYYETAANLGDTDAMNEVAWCYTEGFGTKKDKVRQVSICLLEAFRPSFLCTSASALPVNIIKALQMSLHERSAWAICILDPTHHAVWLSATTKTQRPLSFPSFLQPHSLGSNARPLPVPG